MRDSSTDGLAMSDTTPLDTTTDLFARNLGRGKACDLCRNRKLRCDGVQPVCGRCMQARTKRLARMRQKGIDEVKISQVIFPPCFEASTSDEGIGEDEGEGQVAPFHEDLQKPSKQRRLDRKGKEKSNSNGKRGAGGELGGGMGGGVGGGAGGGIGGADGEGAAGDNDLFFAEILSSQLPAPTAYQKAQHLSLPTQCFPTDNQGSSSSISSSFSLRDPSMLPGVPFIDLPPPAQLHKLTTVFLQAIYMFALFQPQRLFERLAKGRGHEDYPKDVVLHMICAFAYADRPDLDDSLPEGPANSRQGAHYRHTIAAQQGIFEATHHGSNSRGYFDITRVLLLLCRKQYAFGDIWEGFLTCSTALRNCIALKLNKEEPSASEQEQHYYQKVGPRITDGSVMQFKPKDDVELEEIRRTMMLAFIADRNGAAFTLWPNSMAEEYYTMSLPRTTLQEFLEGKFTKEVMDRPPRYFHDSDLYTAQAADADQLVLKGSALFAKCAEVITQLPRDASKEYLNSLPVYQRLESYITTLQINNASVAATKGGLPSSRNSMASFSQWLTRDRSANKYDDALISTTLIPYVCTLTLHEPFTNTSEESEASCRGATRNIIAVLRVSVALNFKAKESLGLTSLASCRYAWQMRKTSCFNCNPCSSIPLV